MAGLVCGGIVLLLSFVVASGAALGGLRGLAHPVARSGVLGVIDVRPVTATLSPTAITAAQDPAPILEPTPAPAPAPAVSLASTDVWVDPDVALEAWIAAHPTPTPLPTPAPTPVTLLRLSSRRRRSGPG